MHTFSSSSSTFYSSVYCHLALPPLHEGLCKVYVAYLKEPLHYHRKMDVFLILLHLSAIFITVDYLFLLETFIFLSCCNSTLSWHIFLPHCHLLSRFFFLLTPSLHNHYMMLSTRTSSYVSSLFLLILSHAFISNLLVNSNVFNSALPSDVRDKK